MNYDSDVSPIRIPIGAVPEGWLDRWCALRWRALLTWIVLTGILGGLIEMGLLDGMRRAVDVFAQYASRLVVVPAFVVTTWKWAASAALFTWYHPLLLRVGAMRSIAWMSAIILGFPAIGYLVGSSRWWDGWALVGMTVALPGLALIGCRSRPWMTLFAGALAAATLWQLNERGDSILGPISRPIIVGSLAANLPYAAVLLYGTRLKGRRPRRDATE